MQPMPVLRSLRFTRQTKPKVASALPRGEGAVTVAFFGEVLLALLRCVRPSRGGLARPQPADVLFQIDQTGPRSTAIVVMMSALIGMMLAYMSGAQLEKIGAQSFLADAVTVGMVREIAALMTAVMLSGRIASAFAAHLATMQAGDEIDALRVLGISPVTYLVLPRLLALMAVGPLLVALAAAGGILAGWLPASGVYGVTSEDYFSHVQRALKPTHVWIGLFKGELYVMLVAIAGCREGLHAGRSAQAVGEATTRAVVKALVWVITAACITTVLFTNLGY